MEELLLNNTISFPGLGWEFTVPATLQIGPVTLAMYGLIIAIGLALAMVYAYKNFRKVGVDPDKATDAIIGGIIGGILGGRLYYVIFSWSDFGLDFSSWETFWNTFSRIFKIWEGGMAIYGGLIGALLVGILVARWRKIKVRPLLDVVGVGFLLGQGIGRWGNFFNVEVFGSNTTLPWGMTGPKVVQYLTFHQESLASIGVTVDPTMPVHPTFFYESLWCLIGFVLLAFYMKHRKFDGEVFLMYLAYYGVERMIVEGMRTDSLMIGSLRVSQLLAAITFIASTILILVIRSKIRSNHDENYLKLFVLTEEGQKIAAGIKEAPAEATTEDSVESENAEDSVKLDLTVPDDDTTLDEEAPNNEEDEKDGSNNN